ncbi:hypothetical protein Xedl_01460 [Xenorhabdus eapokensis]|uniref:Uncharacterized protein n=1 Tax=Xenorhabdus eapokensis TaxID=1873482 RepID=A0A1Q5TUN2_9GAMM|nr:hypothetical protein Xedl_01460 [Xenorhabdus eapokensis]
MADKRRTTIDILALVVTLFGFGGVFKTAAGVRNMVAKGAFHHNMSALVKMVASFIRQWCDYSKLRTHVSIRNLDL